ncbi:MAG: hypothetical protein KGQ54_05075 [Verrucomicrobia bacterium]|nr:hypothetical protein [Verrucomicrobiota bacterium]
MFEDSEAYEEIIRIISKKPNGVTRQSILAQDKLSSEGGTFNKRHQALEESGFITNFKLYGSLKKGIRTCLNGFKK